MFLYLVDDFSSAASSIWLAMAGSPPRGADKIFPPWFSEFAERIPEVPNDPWFGEESLVGSNGCSLPWSGVVDPILEAALFWPGLGSLKLVKTAWGEKLSPWFPTDPPEPDPEYYE